VNVSKLNLEEDKPYIVHQILAYGTLKEIRWLIKTYGEEVVKKVFLNQPIKVYTPSAFRFSQLLLDVPEVGADRYDQTLPRRIG
jgi:hypothetical protein